MNFDMELISPPRTIMDVYKLLPQGTLAELIDGQIFMSPAPTNKHQRVLLAIYKLVDKLVSEENLGEIFVSPSDVYFDDHSNAVQPDLYFVSTDNNMKVLDDEPNRGVPDLIVEILSPSNNRYDLDVKWRLYEKFGVKEYWIIDPATKEALIYQLENNSYHLAGKEVSRIHSPLFNYTFEF
ncbi:MAG: Uma2 family endonuclease [Flammeovirgaceae bacterium]